MKAFLAKILLAVALTASAQALGAADTAGYAAAVQSETESVNVPVPAPAENKVVAHRGGAKEGGAAIPDNSIAALDYAMKLRCYASECDIYYTADRRVIVAHVDSEGKVNGLYPCDATLDELRAAGTLANGEQIPTLEEYIAHAMTEGSCTRLWLDIKNVTQPSALPACSIGACEAACKIIKDMQAGQWVEFICTGNEAVMKGCFPVAQRNGINIAWMSNRSAKDYASRGYYWANLSVSAMTDATHSGDRTVEEFNNAGVALSVYNVDKEDNMRFYVDRYDSMKAICTNYPARLLGVVDAVLGGIDEVGADASGNVAPVYYNLQGVRVEKPETGLHIVVRGAQVTKEIIK